MIAGRPKLDTLSDEQLLAQMLELAARECLATADLLRGLIEVDARRLYFGNGNDLAREAIAPWQAGTALRAG